MGFLYPCLYYPLKVPRKTNPSLTQNDTKCIQESIDTVIMIEPDKPDLKHRKPTKINFDLRIHNYYVCLQSMYYLLVIMF